MAISLLSTFIHLSDSTSRQIRMMVEQFFLAAVPPLGRSVAPVPVSPCSWSFQCQMLRSFTTLCRPSLLSKRIMPREEDDKRLCLLLLTDLDDPTRAPHCSNAPAQDVDLMEGRFGCGLAHMRLYWENMAGRRVCVFSRVVCVRVCPQTAPDCRHPSCSGTLAESGAQTASLTHGRLNCLLNRPGPWRS